MPEMTRATLYSQSVPAAKLTLSETDGYLTRLGKLGYRLLNPGILDSLKTNIGIEIRRVPRNMVAANEERHRPTRDPTGAGL
jgi:hypothetical protein